MKDRKRIKKMNMNKYTVVRIGTAFLLMLGVQFGYAQQPFHYAQYMNNFGPINPTWYLSDPSVSLNTVVRQQWVGFQDAPRTFILNGHAPLSRIGAATGLNFSYDRYGPEKLMELSTFFAKTVRLSDRGEYLASSMSVGFSHYGARYSGLDASDPSFRDDVLETTGTLGFGVMFYIPEKFFAGFSVPRLSMRELGIGSNRNEYDFNTTYYLMAGYLGKLNEVFKIKPVIMATHSGKLPTAVDASATIYMMDVIGLGLNYGTSKELGAHASIYASDRLRIGYSYQFGTASYGGANIGNNTNEIGIGYRLGKKVKKKLL